MLCPNCNLYVNSSGDYCPNCNKKFYNSPYKEKYHNTKKDNEKKRVYLKPNKLRASVTVNFIWILIFFEILTFTAFIYQYDDIQILIKGGSITDSAEINYYVLAAIYIIYYLVYTISGIPFILWFYRAYENLSLVVNNLSFNKLWTIGGWFVPILNWILPYKIMKEIYVETNKLLYNKFRNIGLRLNIKTVNLWWALIILGLIPKIFYLVLIMYLIFNPYEINNAIISGVIIKIIDTIIFILSCLITINVIKSYSKAEGLLYKLVH